jgi:hypothetical protein
MNRLEPNLFVTESIPDSAVFFPRVLPNSSRTRALVIETYQKRPYNNLHYFEDVHTSNWP